MAKSIKTVLVVGAHGMVGRPVVRRLMKEGFEVRALARDLDKAQRALPQYVAITKGSLEDIESIDLALQDCQAVHVSVDSKEKARFRAETDGLKNVITAARNHPGLRLLVLSALGTSAGESQDFPWWHGREKIAAQQIVKDSKLPWTIFEPTWFMESLPLFVKKKSFTSFKGVNFKAYWIAGDDFGRMVGAALSTAKSVEKIIPAQGPEKIDLAEAAKRFIASYNPKIKYREIPLWILKAVGLFSAEVKDFATFLNLSRDYDEPAPDPTVWEAYAKPSLTIESYAGYCRGTGDFPQK